MNCSSSFISKTNIYADGIVDNFGSSFKDTLFHRTAFDRSFLPTEEVCIQRILLFIEISTSSSPAADNGDDLVVQVRIITAAHGTDIFELSMPQGQKQAFSAPAPPTYLLEGADGDHIELWVKNPTRDYGFHYGCEFLVWDAP